jgi:hypothetical protein
MSTNKQVEDIQQVISILVEQGIMTSDEADQFMQTITSNPNLSDADLNGIILDLAKMANIPVGSPTIEKVERWRKIIIGVLIAGISLNTIEAFIPGIYYTLYENISITIKTLLEAGYNNQQINDAIKNPLSIIPPIPNTSRLMTNLTNGLKNGFYIAASIATACLHIICSSTQTITEELTIDNMKFTAKLAGFLVGQKSISYAINFLRGDYDNEIVRFIDSGKIQEAFGTVNNSIRDIKKSIKGTFIQSTIDVDAMKLGITWTNLLPDRRMEPSTTQTINNQIEKTVEEIFSDPMILQEISKKQFLDDMLNIFKAEDKKIALEKFKSTYSPIISPGIFRLLELLFADPHKLIPGRKGFSQMMENPPRRSFDDRSASLPESIFEQAYPGSTTVRHNTKSNITRFDVFVEKERLKDTGLLPEIVLGTHQPITQQDNTPVNRFVYDVLIMPIDENRTGNIYTAIQKVFPDPRVQDQIINFIQRRQKLDYEDIDYAGDVDRVSEIVRDVIKSGKVDLLQTLAGGRRYKKSRQYKKRRTTQRQRRVKGRRTRKGKKRISTKRKR